MSKPQKTLDSRLKACPRSLLAGDCGSGDGGALDSRRGGNETPAIPLRHAVLLTAGFASLLWLLHIIDALLLPAAVKPGVYPRTAAGLIGIALAPLVHGSFEHLISNTLPLLLLGAGALFMYPRAAKIALPILYLAPGLGVWLFARASYHIGASGLTYGLMFFLLVIGMARKDRASAGFSAAILFLYSGMLIGLLPEDNDISFEYHLFGALAGAACAFALRRRDPQLPTAKYDWEDDDGDDDPIIGEQWRQSAQEVVDESSDELYYMDEEEALLDAEWYEAIPEQDAGGAAKPRPGAGRPRGLKPRPRLRRRGQPSRQ